MATPYLQLSVEEVPSTQDLAKSVLERLPVVVVARRQTAGRGRGDAEWLTAPRALAVSVAFRPSDDDLRPFSLMAGVAAARSLEGVTLKWPNDLMAGELKLGGILAERSGDLVIGMGLNLWWPDPPRGIGALHEDDPGPELQARIAGLWAAELFRMVEEDGWPAGEYRELCATLGREITWDPGGRGRAVGITDEGALVVETDGARSVVTSGSVHHVRG